MSTSRRDDLDGLLRAWGEQQRLPDDRADTIRRSILAQPPGPVPEPTAGLSATWWVDLSAQVTEAVVQANDHVNRAARALAPGAA